jgi:transposase-like protein
LAKELGNVAEACRQRGLDRTSFYEWRRRFQTQGFEGLKDLPPIHRSHPQTTPAPVVERIRALALEHPAYGGLSGIPCAGGHSGKEGDPACPDASHP